MSKYEVKSGSRYGGSGKYVEWMLRDGRPTLAEVNAIAKTEFTDVPFEKLKLCTGLLYSGMGMEESYPTLVLLQT